MDKRARFVFVIISIIFLIISLEEPSEGIVVTRCGVNSLGGIIVCGYSIGDLIWPSSPQAGFSVFILVLFGIFLFVMGLVKDKKEKERQKKKMLLAGKKDKDER